MKILADHGSIENFPKHRIVIDEDSPFLRRIRSVPLLGRLSTVFFGFHCWWTGLRCSEPALYVTVGSGHAFVLALLQLVSRFFVRPRTHVMFDLLLDQPARGLRGLADRVKVALFNRVVDAAVVWGRTDVESYAQAHGLDRKKLIFHRFHITLEQYEFEIRDDGYIFAGGNHGRDYRTVIEALGAISYPVFIATQASGIAEMAAAYPNITVRAVTPDDFRLKMAASTLVVEAHPKAFFRTAGHQTFLNAMWMGKPVVMADRRSAQGYFEDGRGWLIVEAEDVGGLREKVSLVLSDRELLTRLGREARELVRRPEFGTLNCMQSIYNLALELEAKKRGAIKSFSPLSIY